jgi:hypothetical protein
MEQRDIPGIPPDHVGPRRVTEMEPYRRPAAGADVEICFRADPGLRPVVRAVAGEAAYPAKAKPHEVREVTDTLVCAVLPIAREGSRLRCVFRFLDGELRIRVCVPNATAWGPETKARSTRILERLDTHVDVFTVRSDVHGAELVCETAVAGRGDDT